MSTGVTTVEVRLFAAAAAAVGTESLEVTAGTVGEAMAAVRERTDDEGQRVLDGCSLLHNAVVCRDTGRSVAGGDRIDVLPPFAGG